MHSAFFGFQQRRWVRSAAPVFLILAALTAAFLLAPGAAIATEESETAPPPDTLNPANRSAEALSAQQTMIFDKGRLSFTARNVSTQELFLALADTGQFMIEGVDLLPITPVSVSYTEMREQDCLTQLLKMVPDVNFIFLAREQRQEGKSVVEKVQIYSKDSSGIAPGEGQSYNPLDFLATGGDLFGEQGGYGGEFGSAPGYIPPSEPPKYIPPDKPPVYIPPAAPPVYIPPANDPVYVPPPSGGDQTADDGGE
jgi:hypothetical protein